MGRTKSYLQATGFAVFCLVVGLLPGCKTPPAGLPPSIQSAPGTTTTVIILRHAGKDMNVDRPDPGLTWQGRIRAKALVEVVGNKGVTAIYCTNLRRNRETVQPLADHLGLKPNLVSKSRLYHPEKLARELLDEFVTKHAGDVVVWVGNMRNIKEMYKLVDGTGSPPTKYGTLCTVVIPDRTPPRIKKETYGE